MTTGDQNDDWQTDCINNDIHLIDNRLFYPFVKYNSYADHDLVVAFSEDISWSPRALAQDGNEIKDRPSLSLIASIELTLLTHTQSHLI